MSFHPLMEYGAGHHRSARELPEEGPEFSFTPANLAKLEEICGRYPAEQRKSAIIAALYLAQGQQGYITMNAMRAVAAAIKCTTAQVEDIVYFYTMFYTRPVGKYVLNVCRTLSCALLGAELYTDAANEVRYAQRAWGDSPMLQATLAWANRQIAASKIGRAHV